MLCILSLSILCCYGVYNSIIILFIISGITHVCLDGKISCLVCVNTYSLDFIHSLLWTLIDSFVWIDRVYGMSFLLAVDTIAYDAYSTPTEWSRVTPCITRISWCCLFSYFTSELQRDGLWACPQLIAATLDDSVSIICTFVDKTIPLTLGEVDVCKLYYWPARCLSRASHRCSSFFNCLWILQHDYLTLVWCSVKTTLLQESSPLPMCYAITNL